MTELLPEFSSLRVVGVFDCELVAFGNEGKPSFHRLCQRMLNRRRGIAVALVVLAPNEEPTIAMPYTKRRVILESYFGAAATSPPRSTTEPHCGVQSESIGSRGSSRRS